MAKRRPTVKSLASPGSRSAPIGHEKLLIEAMRASLPRAVVASAALALGLSAEIAAAGEPPPTAPSKSPPADPIALDIGVRVGFGVRAGSGPSVPIVGRLGGVFGAGLAISPTRRFAVGVSYERSGLGGERGVGDAAEITVSRALDMFWAHLRLHLFANDRVHLSVVIGPGLGIQHATADVLVYPDATLRPSAFTCTESAGPGFGVRAGIGTEVNLGGAFWLTADAQFDHVRMSSDALGECVPGSGGLSIPGMRFGLAYRLDVSRWLR